MLTVLDDGVDGPLLGRGRGGQVMVAFDMRAVIRIDGGPAAPRPAVPVSHGLMCGTDPGPVDLQRPAVVAAHAMAHDPALDGHPSRAPELGRHVRASRAAEPQPQEAAL